MESNKDTTQKSTIEAKKLELPKGGGAIKGISEAFEANSFTGTGSFSIPIPIPQCRNFSPSLSVDYSSGGGNGVFGIGFNVSIASIIRKTSKKIPTYDDEDIFVLTGADDLVLVNESSNSEYDIIALFTIIRTDRNMLLACYSHKHISYRIRTIIRKAILTMSHVLKDYLPK